VYPALAVVGALVASSESADVLWVGGEGGMEATLVQHAGVTFEAIPAAGLHGVGPLRLPGNVLRMVQGVSASRRILKRYKPDALFFTGGYVGVPVAYAGRHHPQAMFVPDIEPALALRWISRWVDKIAVTTKVARTYYVEDRDVIVSGYPTRPELKPVPRGEARQALELDPEDTAVLVFGGSRGARSINEALWNCLPELLKEMQVIHITGQLDWPKVEEQVADLQPEQKARYRVYAYVHDEMATIFSAVDLVVSRAGAAVLGEYPLFGLPAILVPYPHAWRYQWVNARYLQEHGAAEIVKDDELGIRFSQQIQSLMAGPEGRGRMSVAMRALYRPHAAERIADLLMEISASGEALRG
jgi:undecaprenyldiphospho-muramoylpentapeptide beta-N-acetylglucosaminyltransferase